MPFPPGISPKTVTLGIASFADGSLASGRATISLAVNVLHTPSNRPIFSSDITKPFVDGLVTFDLLPTDAPGLNRIDWSYTLRVEIQGANVQPEVLHFLLPTAGPDVVDLDGLVTVPSSAGTPISVDVLTAADIDPTLASLITPGGSATAAALAADPALRAAFVPGKHISSRAFGAANKWLTIGESTPAGAGSTDNSKYGFQVTLSQVAGSALFARWGESIQGAVDGRTAADVLAALPAQLTANPDISGVFAKFGSNDASQNTPLPDFAAAFKAIHELVKSHGLPFVIGTVAPRLAGAVGNPDRIPLYNVFMSLYCRAHGIPVGDWTGALVDPATGYLRADLAAGDGVHPNNAGHLALGIATAPAIAQVVKLPVWLPSHGPQAINLATNPLMAGGTSTALPTGYFFIGATPAGPSTRGTEPPVVGDGLDKGSWLFVRLDNTAGSGVLSTSVRTAYFDPAKISEGDQLLVYAKMKGDPATQYTKAGFRVRNGSAVIASPFPFMQVPNPGPILMRVTAPAAPTQINLGFEITADAGQVAKANLGEVGVFNLTTLQAVGLV